MQSRHSATRANCLSIVTRLPPIAGFVIISALASSSGHPLFGQSADTTPPAVWITAPAPDSTVTGTSTLSAGASDNVAIASVQFQLNGAPIGAAIASPPFVLGWGTASTFDGTYVLTAVARDTAGNTTTSAAVTITIANGLLRVSPQDTSLGLNKTNYSRHANLMTYTWQDYQAANAILIKLVLPALPAGAVIEEAKLYLALVSSDTSADTAYAISAHKIVGKTPQIARATGYSADGVTNWTPNNCCHKSVPLAQADLSPAYDTRVIDKVPGFKVWTVTSMVREWLADPLSNTGLLLNADTSALRDRYRYFASMEHSNPSLRPFLAIRYSPPPLDRTAPTVSVVSPAEGTEVSGTAALTAQATDDTGVAGVQFRVNGAPLGAETVAPPYSIAWDTTAVSDGLYALSAVARDAAGNTGTSTAVNVTVTNGLIRVSPQDTTLNLDAVNYSGDLNVTSYTWPDYQVANAILMKLDLPPLPAGAVVTDAKLYMALVQSDPTPDAVYTMSAHAVIGQAPVIAGATGYTVDGTIAWTPNGCCHDGVPLAQADLSPAYDTRAVDKVPGYKAWTITAMVREWLADPAINKGLVINSDASVPRDRYRSFASMEQSDPQLRPFLEIRYVLAPVDTVPPVISGVSSSSITTSSATIGWSTDEPADTQLEYGTTTAYGAMTTLDPSLATSHTVNIGGLSSYTQYHVRARSSDASGNLRVSPDFTFRTMDGTAPSVSVTVPSNGATVSGTVTFTASATDNVGIAGVQLKVDGVAAGAEDTASPYSISWNTTSVTDGSHTLTAVARDAAGNQTTSAGVTVTAANAVISPTGIATLYPGDAGIENHQDVLFVDRFEDSAISSVFSRWTDILSGTTMSLVSDVPPGSPGARSLNIPWAGGGVSNGGHLYKQLSPGVDDTLYVRYYIKYPTTGRYNHTGIWMGGYNPALSWPNPQAGVKPAGNDRFIAGAEQNTQTARFDHYDYWMNMRQSTDGNYWGNLLLNDPNTQAGSGQWTCVEHMVKLNNPVTASNGEHAIWINGAKVSHLGQGFPNGSWSGGVFTQAPSGSPFEGFRWRSDANLKLNWIWLQNYSPDDPAGFAGNMYFDHVVVAKNYIGCLSGGGADTAPPIISGVATSGISSTGAAIAWTTNEASDSQVEYGTTAAYGTTSTLNATSVTAHTSTLSGLSAATLYHFRVRSRDTAGNLATSADFTFTTPPASPGTVLFESDWDTATGTSAAAVTDGGRWPNYWEFNNGTGVQLLTVVPDGVNGHNALRVQQRGSTYAANVQVDNIAPPSQDYYLRYYMRNDDTSTEGDHIVTVDTWEYWNLTFMRKYAGPTTWRFVTSLYGCGYTYPIGHWGPATALANGQWYRFEYHVEFVTSTQIRVHPRVYDAAGNLIMSDADFRQSDYGGATWNGRSDWTLASYYAAGYSFCVDPAWVNDLGLGNNGQYGATDTGRYWYFSAVEIRTDTWPGPVAPR